MAREAGCTDPCCVYTSPRAPAPTSTSRDDPQASTPAAHPELHPEPSTPSTADQPSNEHVAPPSADTPLSPLTGTSASTPPDVPDPSDSGAPASERPTLDAIDDSPPDNTHLLRDHVTSLRALARELPTPEGWERALEIWGQSPERLDHRGQVASNLRRPSTASYQSS
nr:uncharacterized protein LOC126534807 [Dermacentor andersoni]